MWKEPDSVFSYIEEVNSVFMALGTKSARMSILERMRWVAEDNRSIWFRWDTCHQPTACPREATSRLPPERQVPALCLLSERERSPGGQCYLKGRAEELHDVGRVLLEQPDLRDGEILVQLLQRDRSPLRQGSEKPPLAAKHALLRAGLALLRGPLRQKFLFSSVAPRLYRKQTPAWGAPRSTVSCTQ